MNPTPISQISPEVSRWLAYAVLTGHDDQAILSQIADSSDSRELYTNFLSELRSSPLLSVGQDFARDLGQARWLLELQKKVHQNQRDYGTVPRISAKEVDNYLNNYLAANRPVVITGLVDDWPALNSWNAEQLIERMGCHPVEYTRYIVRDNRHVATQVNASFGEFVKLALHESCEEPVYWTAYNQDDTTSPLLRELKSDIRYPEDYCVDTPGMRTFFWVGPAATRSGLHFDPYNVLFVQVQGSKRFLLYPPQDIPKAYLENDFFSQVDAEAPDLARFPKFSETQAMTVEVGPGETLLLPVGWLHQVRSLTPSISVSLTSLKLPSGKNYYEPPSEFRGVL